MEIETIFDSDREEYEYMQEKREQLMKEQIEEMAKVLCKHFGTDKCQDCWNYNMCPASRNAEKFYNAGYRKQSEGEWIVLAEFSDRIICTKCPICGEEYTYKKGQNGEHVKTFYAEYNFCPNCGAKMKGGE